MFTSIHAKSSTSYPFDVRPGARRSKKVDKRIGYGSCMYRRTAPARKENVPGRKIVADQNDITVSDSYMHESTVDDSHCSEDEANQREIDDALLEEESLRCFREMIEVEDEGMKFVFDEVTVDTSLHDVANDIVYF